MARHPSLAPEDPWWKAAVVYQVYPRSFSDSNGDGIGDLRGVIERLDHLAELGVDVVWLSPIYASPQDDNGYDISDYCAVDPIFGTLDDLDDLVSAVHARGMKLIMDLVVNHTSSEHAWFADSRSGRDSPKRDWYIWRDPKDGREPNNWGSFFSGSAWELDEASGQYYLHLFARSQPDLNWENPEVRAAVYTMMNWWLDRGIDGFRMDVISFLSKPQDLPDGPVVDSGWGDGLVHYGSGPRIHEFLQEMHAEVFAPRDAELLTVGETLDATPERARLYTDSARRELDMVFHFDHVSLDAGVGGKFSPQPIDLVELKRVFATWQEGLADVGWNSLYWNNHDQPRVVSRFGDDGFLWYPSATALATVLHLMRGTPYIYQGEEIGMTNMPFQGVDQLRDIESLNHIASAGAPGSRRAAAALRAVGVAGRDNARTPMQWDRRRHGGFTTGEPWIDANPNHAWLNAESQRGDARSVFAWYQALIRLRHDDPTVVGGRFTMILPDHPQVFAYTRTGSADELLVIANCSAKPAAVDPAVDAAWQGSAVVLCNYERHGARLAQLRQWEVQVRRTTGSPHRRGPSQQV
ncbi:MULTISPECIES: alpha-glucosidase [unclassified Microbacterium]|uniref:glycoside hydrolase family 13 protein n=1 Tax=unclassified Microbacterium TaxID=2609290 RepID=UPI00364C3701